MSIHDFNGAREPMRAIRDLITYCEVTSGACSAGELALLSRAQAGFTTLRRLHGDNRTGEEIAEAAMIEPQMYRAPDLLEALQMTSGALRSMEHLSFVDPQRPIRFTGDWERFGTLTIGDILDHANGVLDPIKGA